MRQYFKKLVSGSLPLALTLKGLLSTWAMMRMGNFHPMNIIGLFLFFPVYYFFQKTEAVERASWADRYRRRLGGFFAFIFTLMYLCGGYSDWIYGLENLLFQAVILVICALGLFFLLYYGLLFLMHTSAKLSVTAFLKREAWIARLPIIGFVLCVLCRIPFLLYSYPGIMTPDSINQLEQVLGMQPFSNHHPWVHTLTISLFYHIGTLFSSTVNGAFAFYTVFQICFTAFSVSYLLYVLSKYLKSLPWLMGILCFYAFMPYHNVMAICIWKDVMFGAVTLIFCASLFDLLGQQTVPCLPETKALDGKKLFALAWYVISGILMCLYRTNGWYAFLFSLPFLLIAFRKHKKVMYPLHILVLLSVLLVKGPVMDHFHVTQPDFVESVSIPLQQVGRVIATGQPLTREEEELIDRVIDRTYVPQLYTEHISDNMKELVRAGNPEYLSEHKGEYFKLWLSLGIRYPKVYFDAYVRQTGGFFDPAITYEVAEADGVIPNETGVYREYILGGRAFVKIREILLKLQNIIPVYGALWSMGSLLWGTLIFLCVTLSLRKFHNKEESEPGASRTIGRRFFSLVEIAAPWIPNLAIICTLLLATPVATEFRYAYNLACCIPLYLGIWLTESFEE